MRGQVSYVVDMPPASMGPQLVSCGCMESMNERKIQHASMGPQLVSCGCGWLGSDAGLLRCFNGAAARELRMLHQIVRNPIHPQASMGPQLVSCGCQLVHVSDT